MSEPTRAVDDVLGTVTGRIAAYAAEHPDQPAVVAADATLSYAELLGRADDLARRLRGLGVSDGSLVGVGLERSAALVVAILAVQRAGAAYVALDPSNPTERLRDMLSDSGAAAVIEGVGDVRALSMPAAEDPGLAYVVYTSGSTGTPKGVMVGHAGLANLAQWHATSFGVGPGVRCSQIASPGFDAAVWETWGCLAAGGTLHVAPEAVKTDPGALRDWLVAEGVEVAFLPTPLAEAVVGLSWPESASLRVLLTGGDRLHGLPPAGLPFALVNNYGVSEASVVSTSGPVGPDADGAPSIGRAITGVELRIVDADLAEVPAGEAGELLVGGVSVARGYVNAPELTAEKFLTLKDSELRWYRTGDVVRQRADGELDYVNRRDAQVQVRGFRIEPGEIVATLDRHDAIAMSEVVAVESESSAVALTAYLQRVPGVDGNDDELREFLGRTLPAHMVPGTFVWLDRMPITANGKIDRAALPAPVITLPTQRGRAPEGDLEIAVAGIVSTLLNVETVGAEDNFLLLGGHSLLGAQLIMRLGATFGIEMSLRTLFENPTIAEIAALVHAELVQQVLALSDADAIDLTQQLAATE